MKAFFENLRSKNRERFIQKHGRKKFLIEQIKAYNTFAFMSISVLTMGSSAILLGLFLLNIIFVAGIIFFVLSGFSMLSALLLAMQLPRIKKESCQAEEELLNIINGASS